MNGDKKILSQKIYVQKIFFQMVNLLIKLFFKVIVFLKYFLFCLNAYKYCE